MPSTPRPPEVHLRPASVGDLIDRALRLYRDHFRTFFVLMLVAQLPLYLLQKAYETALRSALPGGALRPDLMSPEVAERILTTLGVVFPLTFLGMMFLLAIARGALILAGEEGWYGKHPTPGQVARRLWSRLATLVLTYLLLQLLFGAGLVTGMLPGLGLGVAAAMGGSAAGSIVGILLALGLAFVVLLVLYLRWYLVLPVIVLEEKSGFAALRRSSELMAGKVADGILGHVKIRAGILLAVLFLLLAIPSLLIGVPQLLVAAAYSTPGQPPNILAIPFAVRLPFEVVTVLLSTVLTPIGILTMLFFYFDLRIRREGLDLELRARATGEPLAAVPYEGAP